MAQNLQIDPVKRDYVFVNGSPVPSDRPLEACYIALTVQRNRWLYGAPGQGSLLWTLQNEKRSSHIEQQFSSLATQAIDANVIQEGKASAVQVKNIQTTRTGTLNEIDVIPSQQKISQQINFVSV